MYLTEILWIISWPILIYVALKASQFVIRKYEKAEKQKLSK